jgi:glycosyltransferase involved in cell wall biosynthesis
VDFLSFSMNYWEDLWQSRHQVMSRLAMRHKVLFVSPPAYIRDLLDPKKRRDLPPSGLQKRSQNLYSLVPPRFLFTNHRTMLVDRLVSQLREAQIRRLMRTLDFREVILFIWNPMFADVLGKFDEALSCYYVDEEFTSYYDMPESEKQQVREREDILLRNVDLVFANGSALQRQKSRYGNALNVPMGVDFELFSRALSEDTLVPPDLAAIRPPRIGYIGNVNDKVDFEVLESVARSRPEWSLVLVGPISVRKPEFRSNLERLRLLANLHFLGYQPLPTLPNYLRGLDVCLMCYRTDGWAYYGYPLKLHEYLAGGKPVIGSDLPSIREFSAVISIVRTPEEWQQAIEASLAKSSISGIERRVEVARQNTWEQRVRMIEEAIALKLVEKRAHQPPPPTRAGWTGTR